MRERKQTSAVVLASVVINQSDRGFTWRYATEEDKKWPKIITHVPTDVVETWQAMQEIWNGYQEQLRSWDDYTRVGQGEEVFRPKAGSLKGAQ